VTVTRPLIAQERALLAARAADPRPFASFLAVSLGMAVGTLFVAFLVLAVPLTLAGVDFAAWPAKDLTVLGVAAVFAVWTVIAVRNYRRHRAQREPLEAALAADLAGGVAEVERYAAVEAIGVTAPEHGERAYFMRLGDGRVLFVGYWNPPDGDAPNATDAGGFPSTEFELARGPASRLVFGAAACGQPLKPSQAFDLRRHAFDSPRLPDVGERVETSWSDIRATYG